MATGKEVDVPRVQLGSQGLQVSAQGLGCMGMSHAYGTVQSQETVTNVIHHAVERGVTFLDTADMYGPYTNEIMIGKVSSRSSRFLSLVLTFGYRACGPRRMATELGID